MQILNPPPVPVQVAAASMTLCAAAAFSFVAFDSFPPLYTVINPIAFAAFSALGMPHSLKYFGSLGIATLLVLHPTHNNPLYCWSYSYCHDSLTVMCYTAAILGVQILINESFRSRDSSTVGSPVSQEVVPFNEQRDSSGGINGSMIYGGSWDLGASVRPVSYAEGIQEMTDEREEEHTLLESRTRFKRVVVTGDGRVFTWIKKAFRGLFYTHTTETKHYSGGSGTNATQLLNVDGPKIEEVKD